MATYVYRFADGTTIEVQQSMSDEPHITLPHPETHQEEEVTRVPSLATSPVFKGPGFYKNDKR